MNKAIPKGGKLGITLDMDQPRMIRWIISRMEQFEDLSREVLLKKQLIKEDTPITTIGVLRGFIKLAPILRLAVGQAIGESDPEIIDKALEGYIEKGGNYVDLENQLIEAYYLAADPSYIPIWRELLQIASKFNDTQTEMARQSLRTTQAALEDQKETIKKMEKEKGKKSEGVNIS